MSFSQKALQDLQQFVQLCKSKPEILHLPDLKFFKDYLISLGATIPEPKKAENKESTPAREEPVKTEPPKKEEPVEPEEKEEVEEVEEESEDEEIYPLDEIDTSKQVFGDLNKELPENARDEANKKKNEAQQLEREGKFEEALEKYNEAINLFPLSGIFFASRADCYLKMKKPNAAIKDCDKSIEINSDNAKAYKIRGIAKRHLGRYEEAAKDLVTGTRIDYDEKSQTILKFVQEKARKKKEREQKRQAKEQEKRKKQQQQQQKQQQSKGGSSSQPNFGGFGGGGFPGAGFGGIPGMDKIDPEVMAALGDQEIMRKLTEILQDPSKIAQYQNDAKLMSVLSKLQNMQFGQ